MVITTDDKSKQPSVVSDHATRCIGQFQICLNSAPVYAREVSLVEDQFARFSVWAATLRIFRADNTSLDHRLREASDLRDIVAGLLNALTQRIQHCAEIIETIRSTTNSSSSPITDHVKGFHYTLEGITEQIDFLYKVSPPLCIASGRSRRMEIIENYRLHDRDGKEMESHFLETVSAQLQEDFPAAHENTRQRLANMMLYRRKQRLWLNVRTRNQEEELEDLYVCLFEVCASEEEFHESYESWVKHMWRHAVYWYCASKSHDRIVAATKEDYIDHIKDFHPKFSESQIEVLAIRNARHTDRLFLSCPLCGVGDVEEGMEEHVAQHMRKLSLQALEKSETSHEKLLKATDRQSESIKAPSLLGASSEEFSLLLDAESASRMPWFASRRPQSSDEWLQEQFMDTDKIFERLQTPAKIIKIAVLDTGCDIAASHFQKHPEDVHRVEWGFDCVDSRQINAWEDQDGQGTLVVSLLLKILPRAKILVIRVGRTREEIISSGSNVEKALRLVGSRWPFDIDVVNLSYGLNDGIIGNSLRSAVASSGGKMLFFSAANNTATDWGQERYPTCLHDDAIVARAAGVDRVMRNSMNPPPEDEMKQRLFWTLGDNIPCDPVGNTISGCAAAVPILAAFAALIIQYASTCSITLHEIGQPPRYPFLSDLIRRDNLEWLLCQIGMKLEDGTIFVKPRDLFENLENLNTTRAFLELACRLKGSSIRPPKSPRRSGEVKGRQNPNWEEQSRSRAEGKTQEPLPMRLAAARRLVAEAIKNGR